MDFNTPPLLLLYIKSPHDGYVGLYEICVPDWSLVICPLRKQTMSALALPVTFWDRAISAYPVLKLSDKVIPLAGEVRSEGQG